MNWKNEILKVLRKKPLRSGDLIAALGFDGVMSVIDVATRVTEGLKPLRGSFLDSTAQRVLGRLVHHGEVIWQRAANMDNWYRLPGQKFPRLAAPRKRTLKDLVREIRKILPANAGVEWTSVDSMGDVDVWVEFCPFVLSMEEDGWELADGDPICNWCGNTFSNKYPMDVDAKVIVRKIRRELRSRA